MSYCFNADSLKNLGSVSQEITGDIIYLKIDSDIQQLSREIQIGYFSPDINVIFHDLTVPCEKNIDITFSKRFHPFINDVFDKLNCTLKNGVIRYIFDLGYFSATIHSEFDKVEDYCNLSQQVIYELSYSIENCKNLSSQFSIENTLEE